MNRHNSLVQAWAADRATYGIWCTLPGAAAVEIIARQGADYVCVDYQHGLVDHTAAASMLRAIDAGGSTPIARVGWNEPARIMSVLDAGAQGVVVPMVNNAAEAVAAVQACRFPPHGTRSYGPVRARYVLDSLDPDDLAAPACIPMIETLAGVANAAAIAATPGVDAIDIGPSDLALAMGLKPDPQPPSDELDEAIAGVLKACRDAGVPAGIHAPNGSVARRYAEQGFNMISVTDDAPLLAAAVRAELATARNPQQRPLEDRSCDTVSSPAVLPSP